MDAYQNLLFNANRETSEHGPISTYDRQPYLTEQGGQGPSLIPSPNRLHNNFLIADYGSLYTIDHADGSAYYVDSFNFNAYSGSKNDLGQHKVNDHQLFVFADLNPVGRQHCQDELSGGEGETWQNNRCVLGRQDSPYLLLTCNTTRLSDISSHSNNTFYTPTGQLHVACGAEHYTLKEWQQATGQEVGSTVSPLPSVSAIIGWGQQALFLQNGRNVNEEVSGW